MNYRIEMAQEKYIPELLDVERAAAELFPEEDLSIANRFSYLIAARNAEFVRTIVRKGSCPAKQGCFSTGQQKSSVSDAGRVQNCSQKARAAKPNLMLRLAMNMILKRAFMKRQKRLAIFP